MPNLQVSWPILRAFLVLLLLAPAFQADFAAEAAQEALPAKWEQLAEKAAIAFDHRNLEVARAWLLKAEPVAASIGAHSEQLALTYDALGKVASRAHKARDAERFYLKAVQIRRHLPNKLALADLLYRLAILYEEADRRAEAEKVLRECLALRDIGVPDTLLLQTLEHLGQLLVDQRKYEDAEKVYTRFFLLYDQSTLYPRIAGRFGILAEALARQGESDKAALWYKRAMTVLWKHYEYAHPLALGYLHKLGKLYVGKRKWSQAEQAYKSLLSKEALAGRPLPGDSMIFAGLGELALQQGHKKQAGDYFRLARILAGERPAMVSDLAEVYIAYDDAGRAEDILRECLRGDELKVKGKALLLRKLAQALEAQGKLAQAQKATHESAVLLEELTPRDPEVPALYRRAGELSMAVGQPLAAIEEYKHSLRVLDSGSRGYLGRVMEALSALLMAYQSLKRYGDAEAVLHQQLKLAIQAYGQDDDHTARVLQDFGRLYMLQRQNAKAENVLRKALSLKTSSATRASTSHLLGKLLATLGRDDEAQVLIEESTFAPLSLSRGRSPMGTHK